jgi:hypothetical protein
VLGDPTAADEDLLRVRAMQQQLATGLAAAEAAAVAMSQQAIEAPARDTARARRELGAALLEFDEARAYARLDALISRFSLDTVVLADVIVPISTTSESSGNGATSPSRRNTSRLLFSAAGCSDSDVGGARATAPQRSWHAPPGEQHDSA